MNGENNGLLSGEVLTDLQMRLSGAKQEGRVIVPVEDSQQDEEDLRIRFARISLTPPPKDTNPEQSYVPVFTSAETLEASGMPASTSCVQPTPEDLAEILKSDEWIAIDPGQGVFGLRMSDFMTLWSQLPPPADSSAVD